MLGLLIATLALAPAQATSHTGRLTFSAPSGWHTRPSASSMRVAEFVIPKASGDAEDAEAIVYYFGGQGGSAAANIARWIGQMQQPGGKQSEEVARRETRMVNGLKVTLVDVSGTYVAEMRPGAAEHYNRPRYRLRAAVIETPAGPYFLKMTGPAQTVAAATRGFDQFLASLHFMS